MLQFSIKAVFFVVAVAALFAAALANPSMAVTQVAVSVTLVFLCYCALAAILSRSRRPFFVGFALIGCIYFTLAFTTVQFKRDDVLLTESVVESSFRAIHGESKEFVPDEGEATMGGYEMDLFGISEASLSYQSICHCLFTLMLGAIGGVAGSWIAKREDKKAPPD